MNIILENEVVICLGFPYTKRDYELAIFGPHFSNIGSLRLENVTIVNFFIEGCVHLSLLFPKS